MTRFLIALILTMSFSGCYYDSENVLYAGTTDCSSVKGLYVAEVKPLIDRKCVSCHNTSNPGGSINLDNYAAVKSNATKVLSAINHSAGASAMPKGEPKMSDCDIKKIQLWISSGSPEN